MTTGCRGPPLSSGVGARSSRRHTRRRVPAAPDRRQGRGASGGGEVGPEKVVEGRKSQQTDAVRSQTAAMDDLGESQTLVRRRGLVWGWCGAGGWERDQRLWSLLLRGRWLVRPSNVTVRRGSVQRLRSPFKHSFSPLNFTCLSRFDPVASEVVAAGGRGGV